MKLYLYSNNDKLGEIILSNGSKYTKEFTGMLMANSEYFKHRFIIRKYFEDLENRKTESTFKNILNSITKRRNNVISQFKESGFRIILNEKPISNINSELIIHDKLRRTSKGNWVIQIDAFNLDIPEELPEFELFQMEWIHPAPPDGIIGVYKNSELIMEY